MGYLLDTNTLSVSLNLPASLKRSPSVPDAATAAVLVKIEQHRTQLFTAATVVHELWHHFGLLSDGRRKIQIETDLRSRISIMQIVSYDKEAALWHAEQRAKLERAGVTPPFADGQIAAVCVIHGHVLVTDNKRDFRYFDGLQVENWLRSGGG